ncbi:Uncharacterized protein AB751O23_AE_00020 [Chlamydiales bacterium SCGC AB-751-O23]|jgi:excisionase family DNA binding protein|nr:Uncharacterized protein AB751O23_AE_00020 [Chlamydiales bacterium SCGC AB-751-O23]
MFNNYQNNEENKIEEEKSFSLDTSAETQTSKVVSITEAARINNVTRQAIYVAIKLKKLQATKSETSSRWTIRLEDLENYRKEKYSRSKSTHDGELIFNSEKGYYSVNQAAKMLNVPAQKIYYATRIGALKAHRKGAAWVIHTSDIELYKKMNEGAKIEEIKSSIAV